LLCDQVVAIARFHLNVNEIIIVIAVPTISEPCRAVNRSVIKKIATAVAGYVAVG
jgi:hypothetical protein